MANNILKILIVEDNPQNMKLIQMTLRPHGYTFLQAVDGEEAMAIALKENPDLIIMDVQLPRIDGLEVTRRLKRTSGCRNTPIIAVTAYAMKGDGAKAIEAGCDAYLAKPINTRELPGTVARMLTGAQPKDK